MVESKLVELVVAGSNPVGHPILSKDPFLIKKSDRRGGLLAREFSEVSWTVMGQRA